MSGELTANATNAEIVECLNTLSQKVEAHTAEEGAILGAAIAAEFSKHVDIHHTPVIDALYGKPIKTVGGEVVEREEDGLVDQITEFTRAKNNGGVPSKLSTSDKVKILTAVIASAPLLELVRHIGERVFGN